MTLSMKTTTENTVGLDNDDDDCQDYDDVGTATTQRLSRTLY